MKYLKKVLLRFSIVIVVFCSLFISLEFILKLSNMKHDWYKENNIINNMNTDKLKNKNWSNSPVWLHNNEELPSKEDGKKRILIIGDSYIWGDGYDNANNIWWQQFRLMLKENGYNDVDVVGAGAGGYSTKQEMEYIIQNKELMQEINPDLVVIGFVKNDPEFRRDDASLYVDFFQNTDLFPYSKNPIINFAKEHFPYIYQNFCILLSNKYSNNWKFQQKFGYNYYTWMDIISSGEWLEKYENEIIVPLSEYVENELDIPVFFYFTNVIDEPTEVNVKPLFDKYDIEYYYFPDLVKKDAIDPDADITGHKINPANYHPSVRDCNLFATYLLKVLEENYPDILGSKTAYVKTLNINDWMPYKVEPTKIDEKTYEITYPSSKNKQDFLTLPINQQYIKLNLEHPLNITSIAIEGENIKDIDIYINKRNSFLGYDNQEMYKLKKSKDYQWEIDDGSLVTSINISAQIKDGKEQKLKIKINGL